MPCVVLYRINGGPVHFVCDDDGDLSEFDDRDEAVAYVMGNALLTSGQADFQIVELDEL